VTDASRSEIEELRRFSRASQPERDSLIGPFNGVANGRFVPIVE
jgi:hypothetical protein